MKQEYAYPSPVDPKTGVNQLGVTVRDYFAAKAMQAMISTVAAPCLTGLDNIRYRTAKGAYEIADAMMEARK